MLNEAKVRMVNYRNLLTMQHCITKKIVVELIENFSYLLSLLDSRTLYNGIYSFVCEGKMDRFFVDTKQ